MPPLEKATGGGGPYYSRADAASYAGCSVRYFERLALEGGGPPFVRLGRKVVYPLKGLDAWLEAGLVSSTSEATVRDAEAAR